MIILIIKMSYNDRIFFLKSKAILKIICIFLSQPQKKRQLHFFPEAAAFRFTFLFYTHSLIADD